MVHVMDWLEAKDWKMEGSSRTSLTAAFISARTLGLRRRVTMTCWSEFNVTIHKDWETLGDRYIYENIILVLVFKWVGRSFVLSTSYNTSKGTERQITMSPCRGRALHALLNLTLWDILDPFSFRYFLCTVLTSKWPFIQGLISLFELEWHDDRMIWCNQAWAPARV